MIEAGRRQRIMAPKGSLLIAALTALGGRPLARALRGPELAPRAPEPPKTKRVLPPGYQYVGHCGRQQQLRNLRHSFRKVEKLRDPASIRALIRLCESVVDEPDPGYTIKHLAHVAIQAAEGTGTPWAQAMTSMLDMFDAGTAAHDEARG